MGTQRAELLVGIDGSSGSELALRWAFHTAALEGRPVTALLGWTADGLPRNVYQSAIAASHDELAKAAAEALDHCVSRVPQPDPPVELRQVIVNEDPAHAIIDNGGQAALIVVGTHGHGAWRHVLAGSVAQRVVHHAHVPVVVVRGTTAGDDTDRRPVVVGVDGSPASLAALRWAAHQAELRKVPLRLINAYQLGGTPYAEVLGEVYPMLRQHARQLLDDAIAAEIAGVIEVETETESVLDTSARALLDASAKAQLVVVGNRGRGGFTGLLLGSTSHQCVLHAACPVAVVRE